MKDSIISYIKERQTLLTIFAVIVIILSGVQIIDNPERWWVPPLFIISILALIVLFTVARVVLKAIMSIFLLLISVYLAAVFGEMADVTLGFGGAIFASTVLGMYTLCLAISYLTASIRSRWSIAACALVVQMITSYVVMVGFISLYGGIIAGFVAGVLAFVLFYLWGAQRAYRSSHMPKNIASDAMTKNISASFEAAGWHFRDLREKGNKGGYLVWKEHAYYLYPVRLSQEIYEHSRTELRHMEKNINPWLSSIAQKRIPSFRTKNAPIMPVLLDINNTNGKSGKVIAVSLPDVRKKLPFGIFPARDLNSNKKDKSSIITNFSSRFTPFSMPITEKHQKAMQKIAMTEDASPEDTENSASDTAADTASSGTSRRKSRGKTEQENSENTQSTENTEKTD